MGTSRPHNIVIEGPIGVGKTALAQVLASSLRARTLLEATEANPFLCSFYADRKKYAFQTQLFFLLSRFKQQQEALQQDLFAQITVSDYLFARDRIFANLTLNHDELALYERVYELMGNRLVKPDLVVYLQARQEVLLSRIKRRGHEYDKRLEPEYLAKVCRAFNDFFFHYAETPLLIVNTSDIDFVENKADQEALLAAIRKMNKGTHYYNPLSSKSSKGQIG